MPSDSRQGSTVKRFFRRRTTDEAKQPANPGAELLRSIDYWLERRNVSASRKELLPPAEAAELVRRVTVRVMMQRVSLLGVDRSGAHAHYHALLQRGFPRPRYDTAIPELLRRGFADLRSYHVIGSGLGTLPLLLACDGLAAVGVERDEPRHLTATAILRELAGELPEIEDNCRFIGSAFPDAVADIDVSNSMAIITDLVGHRFSSGSRGGIQGFDALSLYSYGLATVPAEKRYCRRTRGTDCRVVAMRAFRPSRGD